MVTIVGAPAAVATRSVAAVVLTEACAVAAIASLRACTLMATNTTKAATAVLRVQVAIATKGLLTLLTLQRGKAGLRLRLAGNAVGSRARTVGLDRKSVV